MARSSESFVQQFRAARRVSTPILNVRTPDPASSIGLMTATVKADSSPLVLWDTMRGLVGLNDPGKHEIGRLLGEVTPSAVVSPVEVLTTFYRAVEDTVLFFSNAHRFWNDPAVVQGIWNVRDMFKTHGTTLVLLTIPGVLLPAELVQDVLPLDEPLPGPQDLEQIVFELYRSADLGAPDAELSKKAVDALVGLAAFPAEQSAAMCLRKEGLDVRALWDRKRQVIEEIPGLSVWNGTESFDDIGGCDNVKRFLRAVISGKEPPRVVVFCDEIEKAFAGTGTDTSGTKTEMTGTILSWMQDREADGVIFVGPPGAAKSAVAKATGNSAGIPTIAFDLSAMQDSLIGASGERLRAALSVIDAVSQGRSLWIATCNAITTLPPELRRRFTLGTYFFDLPTPEERQQIWDIYQTKYCVSGEIPADDGWTGAEIKECCRKAYRLQMSLLEAAQYTVPVARSAAEQIKVLRQSASGRFLSASNSGIYTWEENAVTTHTSRRLRAAGE
jgi:ATPase family associated with various cellular activities (AAA)